ncbi:MAG: multiheme c-type cytochrome [Nannocystaceae bacterium]
MIAAARISIAARVYVFRRACGVSLQLGSLRGLTWVCISLACATIVGCKSTSPKGKTAGAVAGQHVGASTTSGPATRRLLDVSASGAGVGEIGAEDYFPRRRDRADYTGAEVCGGCHVSIYREWAASPHGRAMMRPGGGSVIGDFSGATIAVPGGSVTPLVEDGAYVMVLRGPRGQERQEVDLVLASGRQHQVYLAKTATGYAVLPLIWLTPTQSWIESSAYVPGSVDPQSDRFWKDAELLAHGCFDCHLSQVRVSYENQRPETTWVDLSVNCESCHGPGRRHVDARRAGERDTSYVDLRAIGKTADVNLCGKCHGAHLPLQVAGQRPNIPDTYFMTLADPMFRTDGTQRGVSYQYAGHMVGPCYLRAEMGCSACHTPHGAAPRDLAGRSAKGEHSDRQCTVCHPKYLGEAALSSHSHHGAEVRCIDCHMSFSWIQDDPKIVHRTSDHSISTPRPRESIEFGNVNGCTTCHAGKDARWALAALEDWNCVEATKVRPWVEAFSMAREGKPVVDRLVAILHDPSVGRFVHLSALRYLQDQPADPGARSVLQTFVADAEPQMRFEALYGLMKHDRGRAASWRAQGLRDPHPFVSIMTYANAPSGAPEELDRFLSGIQAHSIMPPFDLLFGTSALLVSRGHREAAAKVVGWAKRHAPDRLRQRIPDPAAVREARRTTSHPAD